MSGDRSGVGWDDRLHGSNGDLGLERWCAGCDEWVMLSDWQDHALHYPQEDSQP